MRVSGFLVGILAAAVLTWTTTTRAETARQAHAAGDTLLVKGDLRGALDAYGRAARADRSNQEYVQQFMLVRRVVLLDESLKKEADPARWERTAQALRSFYVSRGAHRPALAVDEQIHARLNTAWSAAQLAETQLALSMEPKAVEVLSALSPNENTSATRSLHCCTPGAFAATGAAPSARPSARSAASGVSPPTVFSPPCWITWGARTSCARARRGSTAAAVEHRAPEAAPGNGRLPLAIPAKM